MKKLFSFLLLFSVLLSAQAQTTKVTIGASPGAGGAGLPSQTGQAGKFLGTNGTTPGWAIPTGGSSFGSVVTDFGAIGDSTTDNTAAFQAAIDALESVGGGKLLVPYGRFKINGELTIDKPIIVEGMGGGVFTHDYIVAATKIFTTSATNNLLNVRSDGFQLININLENYAATPTAGAGLLITYSNGFKLINSMVDRFFDDVKIIDSYHWRIAGCTFSGQVRYGLWIQDVVIADAGDQALSDCWFFPRGRNATASIYHTSGGGLKVTNTKFNYDYYGGKVQYHYLTEFSGGLTSVLLMHGNSFENFTTAAIKHQGGGFAGYMSFTGNEFAGGDPGATGIDILNASGISITGNVFVDDEATRTSIKLTNCNDITLLNTHRNTTADKRYVLINCTNVINANTATVSSGGGGGGDSYTEMVTAAAPIYYNRLNAAGTTQAAAIGTGAFTLGGGSLSQQPAGVGDAAAKSVSFEDGDDIATANIDLSAYNKIAVEFWTYTQAGADVPYVVLNQGANTWENTVGGFAFAKNTNETIFWGTSNGSSNVTSGSVPLLSAGWSHVVLIYDRTQTTALQLCLVNGNAVTISGGGGTLPSGTFANGTLTLKKGVNAIRLHDLAIYAGTIPTTLTFSQHYLAAATP